MTVANLPAIDHLTPDAKRQLLALLARDLMSGSGAAVSVSDAVGEVVVYAVPPGVPPGASDPARRAELANRLQRLHTAVPLTDVITDLKRQAARVQNPQS